MTPATMRAGPIIRADSCGAGKADGSSYSEDSAGMGAGKGKGFRAEPL